MAAKSSIHRGPIWGAFDNTDTLQRIEIREKRDDMIAANPIPCSLPQLLACYEMISYIRERIESFAPAEELRDLADGVTHLVAVAMRLNPYVEQDLADLQFTLIDCLTARRESEVCSPRAVINMGLFWRRAGEAAAAEWLLRETERRLEDRRKLSQNQFAKRMADLAMVWCALADVQQTPRQRDARVVAARRAWDYAQHCDSAVKGFVMWRYRVTLELQRREPLLVETARMIEQRLHDAVPPSDWIYSLPWLQAAETVL